MAYCSTLHPLPFYDSFTALPIGGISPEDVEEISRLTVPGDYPVDMNLDEVFELYYRLRGVWISVFISWTNSVNETQGWVSIEAQAEKQFAFDTEVGFGAPVFWDGTMTAEGECQWWSTTDPDTVMSFRPTAQFGHFFTAGQLKRLPYSVSPYEDWHHQAWVPAMGFNCTVITALDALVLSSSDETLEAPVIDVPCGPHVLRCFSGPLQEGLSLSAEASVTWNHFWGYDPGDGHGPIWDTSTGAKLRDPFSVQR